MALTSTQVGVIIASCAGAFIIILIILILFFTSCLNSISFSRYPKTTANRDIELADFTASPRLPSGEFEQYGNLTISPGHHPVHAALDIISHLLMALGLPAGAKAVSTLQVSIRPISLTPSEFANHVVPEAEASAAALDSERDALRHLSTARQELLERKEIEAREQRARATAFRCRDSRSSLVRIISPTCSASELPASKAYQRTTSGSRFVERLDIAETSGTELEQALGVFKDIFVIESDEEEEAEIEIAVDPLSAPFGSGKAMAALYHAQ
jgi:hypothetical protein